MKNERDEYIKTLAKTFGVTKKSDVLREMKRRFWAPEKFQKLNDVTTFMLRNAANEQFSRPTK